MPALTSRRVLLGVSFSPSRLLLALVLLASLNLTRTSMAQVLVGPPPQGFSSVAVSPASVTGGSSAAGTVTITNPSVSNATVVTLSSSSPAVTVSPSSLTVPAGDSSAAFSVTTTAVTASTTATIIGMAGSVTKTATLAINPVPAPAVPAYLSNLTLSSTTVTGGSGATGTVTLSSPALANITVALHSSSGVATVPTTCTILANTTQTIFNITTTAVSAAVLVTLSGTYNGWIQGDDLSVQPSTLPAVPPPVVPVIHVAPGNGCAVVSWNRLADGTVSGYNIYRTSGGTTTLLTPTPFPSNFYPDTGLTNDTVTYTYQVAAVDMQGKEQALSAPVSAAPSSATATLNWNNPPSAVTGNTGNTVLYVSWSSAVPSFGTLLFVDGVQAGSGGTNGIYVNGVQIYTTGAGFDFSKLSNGPHTVQYLGFADANETVAGITPPITIQVNNTISSFLVIDSGFDPTQRELCYLSAAVPAGSTWTVQVTSQDGSTVFRTWQGASSSVKLAWDGNDASGKQLPLTDYVLTLTVQPPGTSPSATGAQAAPNAAGTVKKTRPVSPQHGQPVALALISVGASYYLDSNNNIVATPAQDIQLANVLTTAYTTLYGANNFKVIRSDTFDPYEEVKSGVTRLAQLEGWLGTAQVFYLFGHGAGAAGPPGASQTPRSTVWDGVGTSHTNTIELFPSAAVAFSPSDFNILVPKYVKGNNYVFAWIDSCNSAGGDSVMGQIGTVDTVWDTAFNATTFIGDNGFMIINNNGPAGTSPWYKWRNTFWNNMAQGQTITHAYLDCWVVDGVGPGGTHFPYGYVDTGTYYAYSYIGSTRYDCTPGDGYGGKPRVVLYGEPDLTTLVPQ